VHVVIPMNIHAMNLKNSEREFERLCREITTPTCRHRHRLTPALLHSFTEYSSYKTEKFLRGSLMNFMGKEQRCNANSSIDTSRLLNNLTLLSGFHYHRTCHQLQKQLRCHAQTKGSGAWAKNTAAVFLKWRRKPEKNVTMVSDQVQIRNRHLRETRPEIQIVFLLSSLQKIYKFFSSSTVVNFKSKKWQMRETYVHLSMGNSSELLNLGLTLETHTNSVWNIVQVVRLSRHWEDLTV